MFYKMNYLILCLVLSLRACIAQIETYETDMNFRVEPGARTCFFEKGKSGQILEAAYQVIDGQHGDLDISFDIMGPDGQTLASDYKRAYNSYIFELDQDGDYVFCLDNSFSMMNSKLVFVYVMMEEKPAVASEDAGAEDGAEDGAATEGGHHEEDEVLEWAGVGPDGEPYYMEVAQIAESLTRTLKHVVRARHLMDVYGAGKARDSYAAFEDTFIVDVWSTFQISFMCVVGMLQVYMIKKLFSKTTKDVSPYY